MVALAALPSNPTSEPGIPTVIRCPKFLLHIVTNIPRWPRAGAPHALLCFNNAPFPSPWRRIQR